MSRVTMSVVVALGLSALVQGPAWGDERPPAPAKVEKARAPVADRKSETTLRFRFKGESWVEIRDAQGRVLHSRLNSRGTEAEVAGRPPLTVIVGNAPDVQVLYNEREFPLEPHTKVAVARFTVE